MIKQIYVKKHPNKTIGYIYQDLEYRKSDNWCSVSYACVEKSGGLQGHGGMSKQDAIDDVLDMHKDYSGFTEKFAKAHSL